MATLTQAQRIAQDTHQHSVLKPSQAKEACKVYLKARRPFFLRGGIGVGKSSIIKQIAQELKMEYRDVRATLLDPVDLRGLPMVDKKTGATMWAPPIFLPRDGEGIINFDEVNLAVDMTQAALYQIILDRALGEYQLPEGWMCAAAGNRESDKCGVRPMKRALSYRFVHVEMEPDLQESLKWYDAQDCHYSVVAFLRQFPQHFYQHDDNAHLTGLNPRSWEFVSDVMKQDPPKSLRLSLIAGIIPYGVATEFVAYIDVCDQLPNLDALIMNPDQAMVPVNPSALYAVGAALARRANAANFDRVVQYLERLPLEYNVAGFNSAIARDGKLQNTATFTRWAQQHDDICWS